MLRFLGRVPRNARPPVRPRVDRLASSISQWKTIVSRWNREEMSDRLVILVVDDNGDLVASTAQLLESAGYAAVPAYSAREAVDLIDEIERIDLVLSDVRMPDVDGFDLLRVLRHRFPSLPVILMSGLPVTSDDVVPQGATIVGKPFDATELQELIRRKVASRQTAP